MSKKVKKQPKPNYDKQLRAKNKAAPTVAASQRASVATALQAQQLAPKLDKPSPVVSLEPLAPLIVRSGRPFDAQAGADTPRFPPPSTLAGCLRTAWARMNQEPFGPDLAGLSVHGPLLLRQDAVGKLRWLVPKPADAQYFGHGAEARCLRLQPSAFDEDCAADLPEGLFPLRLSDAVKGKTSTGPAWWDWQDLLTFRRTQQELQPEALQARGWSPPSGDLRTHVAIESTTQAAESGRLFQTQGLDLQPDNPRLEDDDARSLLLLARCAQPLSAALVHLGGERRLARLHPEPEKLWPQPPERWFADIQRAGGLTLTLLTPGAFSAGYRPGWLDAQLSGEPPSAPGVRLQLVAAAVERWQPHSGWDLAHREARATRKLVGAGACYWFRLLDATHPDALTPLWLNSVCDLEQDRCDGFGLALPAPWKPTV